jgi:hypothetical protein
MMYRSTLAGSLRAGAFVIALLGLTGAVFAQSAQPTAAQIKLARDVIEASGGARAFDNIVTSILQRTMVGFLQQNPDLEKDLLASIQSIRPGFDKRQSEILDIVARVYVSRFSDAELKDILAFYRSATGKKFVAQIPEMQQQGIEQVRAWDDKISEEIVARLRAEMKKKGHTI